MRTGSRETALVAGSLTEIPLAHALLYIRAKRLTGVFDLRAPNQRHAWIVFHRGCVASVSTTPTIARFGAVAFELGIIDGRTLDESMLESAGREPHAELLLERGVITPPQHKRVLEEQACRRVHHLFTYPDSSTFTFREARPSGTTAQLLVDVITPVWRALVDFPPQGRVHEVLDAIGDRPLRIRYEAALERSGLDLDERALCHALVARPRTVAELRAVSRLAPTRVDLLVYLLVVARVAMPEGDETRYILPSREMWAVEGTPPPPQRFEAPKPIASSTIAAVRGPLDLGIDGVRARALGILAESPCQALGLHEGASVEAARAAYFRLSRLWNPDRLPPELEPARDAVERVFASMTEAHRQLTQAPKKVPGAARG